MIPIGKVAITPKGEFVQGTAYARLDAVSLNGSSYISNVDNNTDSPVDANGNVTANWFLSAKKGDTGSKGDKGDTGAKGIQGVKGDKGDGSLGNYVQGTTQIPNQIQTGQFFFVPAGTYPEFGGLVVPSGQMWQISYTSSGGWSGVQLPMPGVDQINTVVNANAKVVGIANNQQSLGVKINTIQSYNQYDYTKSTIGKSINTVTGAVIDNATRAISGKISVTGYSTLYCVGVNVNTYVFCYKSDNSYIGNVAISSALLANTDYVMLGFPNTSISPIGVYFQSETIFYEYGKLYYDLLQDAKISLKIDKNNSDYNNFLSIDNISVRSVLINPLDYIVGGLVNGVVKTGGGYNGTVTGLIPVQKIQYYVNGSYYLSSLAFYDVNYNYLSDITYTDYFTGGLFTNSQLNIADARVAYIRLQFSSVAHLKTCCICENGYRSLNGADYLRLPRKNSYRKLSEIEVWGDSEAARPYYQYLMSALGISSLKYHSYGGMTSGTIRQEFFNQSIHDCPQIFMGGNK